MKRIGIIATHPIQYHVPLFRSLAQEDGYFVKVYYGILPDAKAQGRGFGVSFAWDIPMLEGYEWEEIPGSLSNPQPGRFFGLRAKNLRKIFIRDQLDAVIVTGWQSYLLLQALNAARLLSLPCVVRGESNAMRHRMAWKVTVHRVLLSQYRAILSIGKENRRFYLNNGVSDERIFHCPYFVDNDRFVEQAIERQGERESLRRNWGIDDDKACFLFAGKLEPKKRIMHLLQAMRELHRELVPVHLLVVGTGELMTEARQFAGDHGLPVTFAGFLNQTKISRAYVAADCLVLPSDYGETWGLVTNEAMASGLPAIVSDRVGCGPDLVAQNVTGMVFPFGDVGVLADAMRIGADDLNGLRKMGEQAKARVLSEYTVERATEGVLEAIDYVSGP